MTTQPKFPWDGQPDAVACNFALGHLIQALEQRLTTEGRLHAETLLAAIGAIAGFSALRALMAELAESKDPAIVGQMDIVQAKNGAIFYVGEPINRTLIPANTGEAYSKLWSVAAGGAVAAGLDRTKLPELGPMFAYVSQTLGGELEGRPSVAKEHQPIMAARELLLLVWPLALMCFTGRIPGASQEFGIAGLQNWPAISARAANTFIQRVKNVLDPSMALTIVMESAIYASKLDPEPIDKATLEARQAPPA
jgi:hypothetical protein